MINKILIVLNTLALIVFLFWFYKERTPEPLSACFIGTATLIGLIWKDNKSTKRSLKQNNKIKENINSPVIGNVEQQTINYFQQDPAMNKKIEKTLKPESMSKEDGKGSVNITSYNQSGGITAQQVNIGNQPRVLDSNIKEQLDKELLEIKGQSINVVCVMGDGEAFSFATQIKTYLIEKGHTIDGVDQAIYDAPVMGQILNKEKREIIIGTKQ